MTLTLTLSRTQSQLQCLAEQLGVATDGHALHYEGGLATLQAHAYRFAGALSLYTYESTCWQPVQFLTVNPPDSGLYCVFINVSDEPLDKQVADAVLHLTPHSTAGIFYYGPDLAIQQQIPVGRSVSAVCFTFTSDTLQALLPGETPTDLLPPPGGFQFIDLDRDTHRLLGRLMTPAQPGSVAELAMYGHTVSFLAQFFGRLRERQTQAGTAGLLQPDIDKLFAARRLILSQLAQPPTQAELAKAVGLSEATLRRYFPRLFGLPPYQYGQSVRMKQAHELLATRRHSVSEVGFLVGYTNLTHFTNAFRKQFGQNPSEFLQRVRQ